MESAAAQYLQQAGMELLDRNFRCKMGEIDLIMKIQQILVFVEVRYRRSHRYGRGADTIDFRKQRKIINASYHFLFKNHGFEKYTYRFDVVSVTGDLISPQFEWIPDAFQLD